MTGRIETVTNTITGDRWTISGHRDPGKRRSTIYAEKLTGVGSRHLDEVQAGLLNRLVILGVWSVFLDYPPNTSETVVAAAHYEVSTDHVAVPVGATFFVTAKTALTKIIQGNGMGELHDFADEVWFRSLQPDRWTFDFWALIGWGEVIEVPPVISGTNTTSNERTHK
ncbi:MAG: hypothetical protein WD274_03495 [Acidimicrobiia bacterium]